MAALSLPDGLATHSDECGTIFMCGAEFCHALKGPVNLSMGLSGHHSPLRSDVWAAIHEYLEEYLIFGKTAIFAQHRANRMQPGFFDQEDRLAKLER